MKTAIITGATGCLGFHVVQALISDGDWNIVALHRRTSDTSMLSGLPVTLAEVDLHDMGSVVSAVPKGSDVIFHLAANVAHHSDPNQWADNVLATRNLAEAALRNDVGRFIFTSTGAARFSKEDSDPKKLERQLPSGYAFTKRLAELEVWAAAERGLDAVILQPIIILGEYDFHGNYSQLFKENALTKLRAALPGHLEFCDAEKIAAAHLQAFYTGKKDHYYVLGGAYLSWFELLRVIADVTGMKPPLFVLKEWMLRVIAFSHTIGFRLFGIHPQMTTDLIWLLGDEDPLPRYEVRSAEEDLGYRRDVDIHELCERVYRWMESR